MLTDLTLAGTKPQVYGPVLTALLQSSDCDLVIPIVGSSSQFRPDRAVLPIHSSVLQNPAKPLAAFLTPHADASLALLADAGIAAFRTPESFADALRAFFDWRAPRQLSTYDVPEEERSEEQTSELQSLMRISYAV